MNSVELELSLDSIRDIGLSLLESGLRDYAANRRSVEAPTERLTLLVAADQQERVERLREMCGKLGKEDAESIGTLADLEELLRRLDKPATPVDLSWLLAVRLCASGLRGVSPAEASPLFHVGSNPESGVTSIASPDIDLGTDIGDALEREMQDMKFVAAVMEACLRQRSQTDGSCALTTADDEIALEKAYSLLDHGVRLPKVIKPLYRSARRQYQTYLAFADPGPGHLRGTVRESRLLAGTLVHIEWIDRDSVDDKSIVEAYRLPSLRSAARVRLHVGGETPCTVFIGRPVFEVAKMGRQMEETDFQKALLKAAHTMASICSSMFALGLVDCKVAMDGMTTGQAVAFMKAVAGNVVREPGVQMLSAAFNINTPLHEDRPEVIGGNAPWWIVNSFEVARKGIELVSDGRFDKIAWDGASNQQPSLPIISQLTMPKLHALVHEAHERGLETYISAGLEPEHMRWAVYSGVGGVGIGTSLHHVNPVGKVVGEIHRDRVLTTLKVRDDAASSSFGQAAATLARLDWRMGEGSLSESLNGKRHDLYERLQEYMPEFEGRLHEEMALAVAAKDNRAGARERLGERLDAWTRAEARNSQLDASLEEIGRLEKEERTKADAAAAASRPVATESFGPVILAALAWHPWVERAERILALHDSKEAPASQEGWDDATLEELRTALRRGRIDLLSDIFAKVDERRLY